ncbi:MAG: threonylcarbamoyl-AMP synthase [Endomicrobium sp.]|jgi:L-threonylcarbamoyladenylate synthase|nr:threonylcarbamoyl-AMP synthase [Endomicrobium sp.]
MTLKISSRNKKVHKKTAEIIKSGGIAIIPTDTVYGFAVDAFNIKAQKALCKIKSRSQKKPFILMSPDIKSMKMFVEIPEKALKIAEKFWPGQLTLIFSTTEMGKILSGGRKDLGVRIPDNKFVLKLLKETGKPVFTTSVNISSEKSAKNIDETSKFDGIVDIAVDGGQCKFSFESTVIDMVEFPYTVVRKGCLNTDEILKFV